jgi:hypothetical protein
VGGAGRDELGLEPPTHSLCVGRKGACMHLIYLDESGNTGTDLDDRQQPVFLLGALIVPEDRWQSLESDLEGAIEKHLPEIAASGAEIHAAELRGGRGHFKGIDVASRIAMRDEWLQIAHAHELRFVYRAIVKKRFQKWMHEALPNITINPYLAAFPLVARVVDDYLSGLPGNVLGMFISDENKEIVRDIEKSIKILRSVVGTLRLAKIVEKGFFIDSTKSRPLQLCDLCALTARKIEESSAGAVPKETDEAGFELLTKIIHRGNESFQDVLVWLAQQRAPGQ